MTCETCKWWVETGDEHEAGAQCCTRFPPVLLGESGFEGCMWGVWPETTKATVACGEYTAMKVAPDRDEGKAE